MGYNVQITYSNATIPASNLEEAYKRMCALNITHHDDKYGGKFENGVWVERWFSWLSPNYPDELESAEEILDELGFETEYLSDGSLAILDYDGKQGQEELFLESIEDLTYGRIEWIGEDDARWTTTFQEFPDDGLRAMELQEHSDLNQNVNVNTPRQFEPNQVVIFTYPGYTDANGTSILTSGRVKGIATTGVPVLGRSIIIQPMDEQFVDTIRGNGYYFECICVFESQIR